jgi:hypothetical protein
MFGAGLRFFWNEVNEAELEADMTRPKPLSKQMSWEEFFKENPGEPLEVLRKRHAADVKWAEANRDAAFPDAVRIRIAPGRPPKGQEAPVQVKAVKMPQAFWEAFQHSAEAAGLTLHAAMRNALLEWAGKNRAG